MLSRLALILFFLHCPASANTAALRNCSRIIQELPLAEDTTLPKTTMGGLQFKEYREKLEELNQSRLNPQITDPRLRFLNFLGDLGFDSQKMVEASPTGVERLIPGSYHSEEGLLLELFDQELPDLESIAWASFEIDFSEKNKNSFPKIQLRIDFDPNSDYWHHLSDSFFHELIHFLQYTELPWGRYLLEFDRRKTQFKYGVDGTRKWRWPWQRRGQKLLRALGSKPFEQADIQTASFLLEWEAHAWSDQIESMSPNILQLNQEIRESWEKLQTELNKKTFERDPDLLQVLCQNTASALAELRDDEFLVNPIQIKSTLAWLERVEPALDR